MNQFHLIQRWTLSVFRTAALLLTLLLVSPLTSQATSNSGNNTDTNMAPAACSLPATVTTATQLADCITAANSDGAHDTITLGANIMLSGLLPVIASDIGGMAELVDHGVNGFQFPRDDPAALAHVMKRAAREEGLWSQMVASLPDVPMISDITARHLALYNDLIMRSQRKMA